MHDSTERSLAVELFWRGLIDPLGFLSTSSVTLQNGL